MDSGKSGSMQSSSDEELSSRGESISSFLNSNPSPHFGSISTTHQQQSSITPQNPTFFDPHHSNYSQSQYNDGNNNDHLVWSRNLRSEPNYANLGNLTTPSLLLPSSRISQSIASSQAPFPNPSPSVPPPQRKNPKKRTRASRRAPTTVLTTDTANFRQMVQEFTGIPAVPLSGSPYSRRLDLFSSIRSGAQNGTEDPLWFASRRAGHHLDSFGPLQPVRPSSSFPSSSLLNSNMMNAASGNIGASSSNISSMPSTDHFLNQQKHDFRQHLASNASMNFGGLSGFPSHESRFTDDGNLNRWKVEETVRNSDDGVQENLVTTTFDKNIIDNSITDSVHNMSGYNLNISEKGLENVASSGAEGNVASWISPSD